MKIEWKKSGGAFVTLGDDALRQTIEVLQWGGAAAAQVSPLFRATSPMVAGRGNVTGVFSFGSTKSHASLDAAAQFFADEYARLGEMGELKMTVTSKVVTFANALLQGVDRGGKEGVRLQVVYSFVIRTVSVA